MVRRPRAEGEVGYKARVLLLPSKHQERDLEAARVAPAAVMDSRAARMSGSSLKCRHAVRRSLLSVSPSMRT